MVALLAILASGAEVSRYREGPPDPRVVATPASIGRGVARDPAKYLPKLVHYLTSDTDDPFLKTRRLHDWIVLHVAYDHAAFVARKHPGKDPVRTLRTGTAVCDGFSTLFDDMAALAGLETVTIPGYARGSGYTGFNENGPLEADHVWNAVSIDDRWYLLDMTGDSRLTTDGSSDWDYTTSWLFTDPDVFLHTHWPEDPAWQLAENRWDEATFRGSPALDGGFDGMMVDDGRLPKALTVSDEAIIRFRPNEGVEPGANLLGLDGVPLRGHTWVEHGDGEGSVHVTFPAPGRYMLVLGARSADVPKGRTVAVIGLEATSGAATAKLTQYVGWKAGDHLLSPSRVVAGAPFTLTLRLPDSPDVFLDIDGQTTPMTRKDDVFAASLPALAPGAVVTVGRERHAILRIEVPR